MKFVIFCFVLNLLPIIILSKESLRYSKEIEECKKEIKVNDDEYYKFKRNELPTTKRGTCMLACYYKKMETITANGKINATKIVKEIDHIKNRTREYKFLKSFYQACSNMSNRQNDTCEVAKKFAQCIYPIAKRVDSGYTHFSCISNYTDLEVYYAIYISGIPRTRNEQCLLACAFKQGHMMTADNKINPEIIKLYARATKRDKRGYNYSAIFTRCQFNVQNPDQCVAAKNIAECILPKTGLFAIRPKYEQDIEECKQQTHATEIETYNAFKMSHIPTTKRHSCVLACLFKRNGILSANNTISIEPMKKKLNYMRWIFPDLFKKSLTILEDCKLSSDSKLTDECDIAGKFIECYLTNQNKIK